MPPRGDEFPTASLTGRIDRQVEAFVAIWRRGGQPRIEDFIAGWTEPELSELLHQCLLVDLQHAQTTRETAQEEYSRRFPAHRNLIRDVFQSIAATGDTSVDTDLGDSTTSPLQGIFTSGCQTAAFPGPATPPDANQPESPSTRRFGGYELLDVLGRGGMGVVYKARQVAANRIVALKLIRPDLLSAYLPEQRAAALARFQNEVQAAARIDHDHVVTVYDVGVIDHHSYYAMRFVEGESLRDCLTRGPLQPTIAARYIEQVSRALSEAHRLDILHRDLKPHNILVDRKTDRALLADFGLAKLVAGDQQLTATSAMMGSPPYMSPEQAHDSGRVTPASDQYGMGATLYHLLTGRPPFQAAGTLETLAQVTNRDPIAPRTLNPAVPRDLETICLKCLEKDPARRYPSVQDLAEELARFVRGEPILARPIGRVARAWRWCKRNPAGASLIATIASSVLIVTGAVAASFININTAKNDAITAKNQVEQVNVQLDLKNAEARQSRDAALAAKKDADELASKNLILAGEERALRTRAQREAVLAQIDNALHVAQTDGPHHGVLHFAHALQAAQDYQIEDLEEHVREQLGAWNSGLFKLRGIHWHDGPDGRKFTKFHPQGHLVVNYSDSSLDIVDVVSQRTLAGGLQHPAYILRVNFSPHDDVVRVVCSDQTVHFWTPDGRVAAPSVRPECEQVAQLIPTATADWIMVSNKSHALGIELRPIRTADPAARPPIIRHPVPYRTVGISEDRRWMVLQNPSTFELRVFDSGSGSQVGRPIAPAPGSSLGSRKLLRINPENGSIVTQDGDSVCVWDVMTAQLRVPSANLRGAANAVTWWWSEDGNTIWIGGGEAGLKVGWVKSLDLTTGVLRGPLLNFTENVISLAVDTDQTRAAVACRDSTVEVWDLKAQQRLLHVRAIADRYKLYGPLRFVDAGRSLAMVTPERLLGWRLAGGEPLATNELPPGKALFDPAHNDRAFVIKDQRRLTIWDLAAGAPIETSIELNAPPIAAALSSSGKFVAVLTRTIPADLINNPPPAGIDPALHALHVEFHTVESPQGSSRPQRIDLDSTTFDVGAWMQTSFPQMTWNADESAVVVCGARAGRGTALTVKRDTGELAELLVPPEYRHDGWFHNVVMSNDGRRAVTSARLDSSGHAKSTVIVWDTSRALPLAEHTLTNATNMLYGLDDRTVYIAQPDRLQVLDTNTGQFQEPILCSSAPMSMQSLGANLLAIQSGSSGGGGQIQVWDISARRPGVRPITFQRAGGAAWNETHQRYVVWADRQLVLHSLGSRDNAIVHEHERPISAACFDEAGDLIAAAHGGAEISVHDAKSGILLGQTSSMPSGAVTEVRLLRNQSEVRLCAILNHSASQSSLPLSGMIHVPLPSEECRVWTQTTVALTTRSIGQAPAEICRFTPTGNSIVTVEGYSFPRRWDTFSGQELYPAAFTAANWTSPFVLSRDSRFMYARHADHQIVVSLPDRKLEDGDIRLVKRGKVRCAAFSDDSNWLVTTVGREARRVSLPGLQRKEPALWHTNEIVFVGITADGALIAACDQQGNTIVWDSESGEPIDRWSIPGGPSRLVFQPDGSRLLCMHQSVARLRDLAACDWAGEPLKHTGAIIAAQFSDLGDQLMTADSQGGIRMWRTSPQPSLIVQFRHQQPIDTAAMSASGQYILSGRRDGMAQVWSVSQGKRLGPPIPNRGTLRSVEFSSDRQFMLLGGNPPKVVRRADPLQGKPERILRELEKNLGYRLESEAVEFIPRAEWIKLNAAFSDSAE